MLDTFNLEPPEGDVWHALADVFSKFDLPTDPWEDLAAAMAMDIEMPYFKDWRTLQKYMRGASVAPAIVFMHLVLTHLEDDEYICQWSYEEVTEATEDLAFFCYWTHILRDISRDLDIGKEGLIYIPMSELTQHGLTPEDLHRMKREENASFAFKAMAEHLYRRARTFEQKGRQYLPKVAETASPERWFALCLLTNIYSATLTKIEQIDFDVFADDGELTLEEKREVLNQTAIDCDMDLIAVGEIFDAVHD
jgi:phytoene/squalene synthetase